MALRTNNDMSPSERRIVSYINKIETELRALDSGFSSSISALDILTGVSGSKAKWTPEGGLAIKLKNKTGAPSVKGYCVTADTVVANAVKLVPVDAPSCIGVFYEAGVADGSDAWVVVSGIADVYFWDSTTMGFLARTGLTADTGETAGMAMSEAVPSSPFGVDKHFCEIGHILETRVGAGLAKVVLHFN